MDEKLLSMPLPTYPTKICLFESDLNHMRNIRLLRSKPSLQNLVSNQFSSSILLYTRLIILSKIC